MKGKYCKVSKRERKEERQMDSLCKWLYILYPFIFLPLAIKFKLPIIAFLFGWVAAPVSFVGGIAAGGVVLIEYLSQFTF